MALFRYYTTVEDRQGNAQPNASVTIYDTGTTSLSSLFEDDGITSRTNPLTADASGVVRCMIASGTYDIKVIGSGFSATYTKVNIGGGGGPTITAWTGSTAVINGSTAFNPTKGTPTLNTIFRRRVGDTMEIRFEYGQASGTGQHGGEGDYLIPIPDSQLVDLTKISLSPSGGLIVCGYGNIYQNGSGSFLKTYVILADNANMKVFIEGNGFWGENHLTFGSANFQSVFITNLPIAGWS